MSASIAPPPVVCDFEAVARAAAAAQWQPLTDGIYVKLRPLSGLAAAAIQAAVVKDLSDLKAGGDVLERYGFDPEDAGLLADDGVSQGFAGLMLACVRGVTLIEAWNLVDGAGEPVPIGPDTVRALFQVGPAPGLGGVLMLAFNSLVDDPLRAVAAEGNGSGSSSNGATAGEPNTAGRAAKKASRARAEAASSASAVRKSRTPPRRPKAT